MARKFTYRVEKKEEEGKKKRAQGRAAATSAREGPGWVGI